MDDTLLQKLAASGVNTFSMNSGLTENDFGWGSANFHKMVRTHRAASGLQTLACMHCLHLLTEHADLDSEFDIDTIQGREKINLIYTFTKMGHAILVSDVDTVWMQNPLPYMAKYPEADCLVSSDHLVSVPNTLTLKPQFADGVSAGFPAPAHTCLPMCSCSPSEAAKH